MMSIIAEKWAGHSYMILSTVRTRESRWLTTGFLFSPGTHPQPLRQVWRLNHPVSHSATLSVVQISQELSAVGRFNGHDGQRRLPAVELARERSCDVGNIQVEGWRISCKEAGLDSWGLSRPWPSGFTVPTNEEERYTFRESTPDSNLQTRCCSSCAGRCRQHS